MSSARLPYAKQLSPAQVEMRELLQLARNAKGDRVALQSAIGRRFFRKDTDPKNESISAMNCFLSMRWHGLVAGDASSFTLTDLADDLLATKSEKALVNRFATYLLLEQYGLQLVEVVDSLQSRGQGVTVPRVAAELQLLGIDAGGKSGENVNPMRLWLERAGVFSGTWNIDSTVLKSLVGASTKEISELVALPPQQQAFLRAMATLSDPPPYDGAAVRRLAESQSPEVDFDTKAFANAVLGRLETGGWITVTKTTDGRGGKSQAVTPTQRFREVVAEPLLEAVVEQVHLQDPASLRRPLPDLLAVVDDSARTNQERGMALEGVCIQVVRLAGMRFLGWRVRGDDTMGAEVDVVADTAGAPYLIVQVQSKASAITGREIIDREVGVSAALKSNVILFVTAKTVGPAARKAAAMHMQESALSILFLEGADLRRATGGTNIGAALAREWERVRDIRSRRGQERTASISKS